MKTEIITCDICGYKFSGKESWEGAPVSCSFTLSPPRQRYEGYSFEHVCWYCVKLLKRAVKDAVEARLSAELKGKS